MMIWGGAMKGKRVKVVVVMSVLLLLLSCVTTGHLVGAVGAPQSSVTTMPMRPFLRDAREGNVVAPKRFLLTTRPTPIGFPPPPAMLSPSPPEY